MKIALRKHSATNANFFSRLFSGVIKIRLVSQYCHAGVVINNDLYHINASSGAQKIASNKWSPKNWVLIDIGGDDNQALLEWQKICTPPIGWRKWVWTLLKGYDYFSLIAFVGIPNEVNWLDYCFEVCWRMAGKKVTGRVTPEMLLELGLK